MTAAITGKPTGDLDASVDMKLAVVTDGDMVNLKGGLPIMTEGQVIGGIGSGTAPGFGSGQGGSGQIFQCPGFLSRTMLRTSKRRYAERASARPR